MTLEDESVSLSRDDGLFTVDDPPRLETVDGDPVFPAFPAPTICDRPLGAELVFATCKLK